MTRRGAQLKVSTGRGELWLPVSPYLAGSALRLGVLGREVGDTSGLVT